MNVPHLSNFKIQCTKSKNSSIDCFKLLYFELSDYEIVYVCQILKLNIEKNEQY